MARRPWTESELNIVRENFSTENLEWLSSTLNRSQESIKIKANRIGVVTDFHWKEDQVTFLKENYAFMSNEQLAEHFGFKLDRIQRKAELLGLGKGRFKKWTVEEDEQLRDLVSRGCRADVVNALGLSRYVVEHRVQELGLSYAFAGWHEDTKPELEVAKILEQEGISFVHGKSATIKTGLSARHHWKLDFLLEDKCVIEVQGDYFHCNPKRYPDGPKNDRQRYTIEKDSRKRQWLKDNGYRLLEIWESDCYDHDCLLATIQKFLKSSDSGNRI